MKRLGVELAQLRRGRAEKDLADAPPLAVCDPATTIIPRDRCGGAKPKAKARKGCKCKGDGLCRALAEKGHPGVDCRRVPQGGCGGFCWQCRDRETCKCMGGEDCGGKHRGRCGGVLRSRGEKCARCAGETCECMGGEGCGGVHEGRCESMPFMGGECQRCAGLLCECKGGEDCGGKHRGRCGGLLRSRGGKCARCAGEKCECTGGEECGKEDDCGGLCSSMQRINGKCKRCAGAQCECEGGEGCGGDHQGRCGRVASTIGCRSKCPRCSGQKACMCGGECNAPHDGGNVRCRKDRAVGSDGKCLDCYCRLMLCACQRGSRACEKCKEGPHRVWSDAKPAEAPGRVPVGYKAEWVGRVCWDCRVRCAEPHCDSAPDGGRGWTGGTHCTVCRLQAARCRGRLNPVVGGKRQASLLSYFDPAAAKRDAPAAQCGAPAEKR